MKNAPGTINVDPVLRNVPSVGSNPVSLRPKELRRRADCRQKRSPGLNTVLVGDLCVGNSR